LDFQALKSSLEKPSIFGHVVPEKMYLIQLMLHFSHGVKVIGCSTDNLIFTHHCMQLTESFGIPGTI